MSKNVKVNETTYSGVSVVELPLSSGSGKAQFKDVDEITTPSGSKTITTNGTHDVTNFASAIVNVSTSGGGVQTFASGEHTNDVVSGGFTITHNLSTKDVIVFVFSESASGGTAEEPLPITGGWNNMGGVFINPETFINSKKSYFDFSSFNQNIANPTEVDWSKLPLAIDFKAPYTSNNDFIQSWVSQNNSKYISVFSENSVELVFPHTCPSHVKFKWYAFPITVSGKLTV